MRSLARVILGGGVVAVMLLTIAARSEAACSSGGSVSNVNDCVPAGKSSKDCFLEWSLTPVPPADPSTGFPTAKIECLDNDPSCDNDITPGQCTFLVGTCVNVVDGRFTCAPTDAGSFVLKKPSDKDTMKPNKNPFTRANRRGLDLGLAGIVPTATTNVCTSEAKFVVPLKKGIKTGKGKIKVQLLDSAVQKDSDTLKLTCLPNPAIATIPCASARQITSAAELIGGPLAMGKVGDWLIENDKARFIVRDAGRDFSFMLTYGGHLIDADLQRKMGPGSLAPPYPAGRDSFLAMTPLINISSTDNPTSITVVNNGAAGGAAVLRTQGPDDLFDPIDPRVAIKGFSTSLSVPPSAIDNDLPLVDIVNEYTLNCGDDFLQIETIISNGGGTPLDLYIGDYTNGGGQLEMVGPGLGFGEAAIRLGGNAGAGEQTYDFLGWFGFGEADQVSYGLIPQIFDLTSSFTQSGVAVPVYGQNLVGILLAPDLSKPPGILNVPAGGMSSFTRWFAVGDNGMGRILDARHALAARGDITPAVATGFVNGTVRVGGVPIDGARVAIVRQPGNRGAQSGLVDVFETKDGGFYQGTLPKGDYVAMVKVPGYPYEGGGATPLEKPIKISASTVVDFDVPDTGFVRVTAVDHLSNPLAAKVSVVGVEATPDPTISENAVLATVVGNIFGVDAREKVTIHGLPQVHFAGPSGDTGFFAVPPGDYQIVVSHGPEYSVSKTSITVAAGGSQTVNATLARVVDTMGFISSDYHVHLINSPDSVITKNERIITMLAEGVDYFVASDHDFLTDLSADVAALGASSLVKTAISDEITYFDSGHFGAWPLDLADPTSVTGGAVDWGRAGQPAGGGYPSNGSYDLSPDEMASLVLGPPYNAIVLQANHFNSGTLGYFRVHGIDTTVAPPQSDISASSVSPAVVRLNPALTTTYTNQLTALELWIENSRSQNALALGENLGDWFNMLNNFDSTNPNLRKTATFDSDTHSTTIVQAGGPRNMVASAADDPPTINTTAVANNLNDGRNIGTNGPFPRVSIVGDAGATARHALGNSLLVPATLGTATINVEIQSPDWAEFDQVQIFVNKVPSCIFQCIGGPNAGATCTADSQCPEGTCGKNFVGAAKKVCTATPSFTLNKGTDFTVASVPVNGQTRLDANVSKVLAGGDLPAGDAWVVVVVKGRDGISKPLFPMAPQSILPRACSGNPCRACTLNSQCSAAFAGTCTVSNQTTAELADGNLGQCGVTALAITNPLFIDRNGDGLYKGAAIP